VHPFQIGSGLNDWVRVGLPILWLRTRCYQSSLNSLNTLVMIDLKAFQNSVASISTVDLQKILGAIELELGDRTKKDTVELIDDFCSEDITLQSILAECESLKFATGGRNKAAAKWLSSNNEPYIYNDSNPFHAATDIHNYPGICKLMKQINSDPTFTGPVDSALILKYSSGSTSTSLHADDEDHLDQTKSICNFSIGSTRTIEFYDKNNIRKHIRTVEMGNNSMTHMKPGTQQLLKHMVRGTKGTPGVRYSISFRALVKKDKPPAPTPLETPVTDTTPPTPKRRVCLIAGDSYPARLDVGRLSRKNTVQVEMLAVGGSKLDKVAKQLEDYVSKNKDVVVEKVCISVGTNDIRNCHNGVNHLMGPFKQFCQKIVDLFPDSKVFFQTLLPLPCGGNGDWKTNSKVIRFNQIIFNECVFRRFYIIDAFNSFTLPVWNRWSPHIRNDRLFSGSNIHPSDNRGNGVLARLYIRVLHSRYFNPNVFQ